MAFHAVFECGERGIQRVTLGPSSHHAVSWKVVAALPEHGAAIDRWMKAYRAGHQLPILPPLDWGELPSFTRQILQQLQTLPPGQLVTYRQLATLAGRPNAARAVGQACGRNPFPLLIPCHRVVASQGFGGFAFGVELKKRMLEMEGWHASSI